MNLKKWTLRYAPLLTAALYWLIAVGTVLVVMDLYDLSFVQLAERVQYIMANHWYGPLAFLLIFLIRPITLIPAIVFVAMGAVVYGFALGFVYGLTFMTLSALLPYYAGRMLADRIKADDAPGPITKMGQKLAGFMRQNAFESILALRLAYAPYDIVSVVAGHVRVPAFAFVMGTIIGNLSPVFAFAALGGSLEGSVFEGNVSVDPGMLLVSALVFVVGIGAARGLKNHAAFQMSGPEMAREVMTWLREAPTLRTAAGIAIVGGFILLWALGFRVIV